MISTSRPASRICENPSTIPDMPEGEWVRITVSDTGVGIAEDVIPHIFEPFYTTKPPGEGSGLGLAQVYGIITQHEGYVDVANIGKSNLSWPMSGGKWT